MWFVPHETYDREITDPGSGEKATVTLRCLNSGDRTEIDDAIRMDMVEDAETGETTGRPDMRLGTMKLMIVTRALVGWSLPQAVTPATIAQLDPEVFAQIFAHASFGKPPEPESEESPTPPPTPLDSVEPEPTLAPTS